MAVLRSELVPIVEDAAGSLGYQDLREQQKDAILTFLEGNDVFVALSTGYGKSLCYGCLPAAFDSLRSEAKSIMIVISPLVALMKDQVKNFQIKKHACACVQLLIITSLAAIYFSETSNICPVKVSNHEIWHRHK